MSGNGAEFETTGRMPTFRITTGEFRAAILGPEQNPITGCDIKERKGIFFNIKDLLMIEKAMQTLGRNIEIINPLQDKSTQAKPQYVEGTYSVVRTEGRVPFRLAIRGSPQDPNHAVCTITSSTPSLLEQEFIDSLSNVNENFQPVIQEQTVLVEFLPDIKQPRFRLYFGDIAKRLAILGFPIQGRDIVNYFLSSNNYSLPLQEDRSDTYHPQSGTYGPSLIQPFPIAKYPDGTKVNLRMQGVGSRFTWRRTGTKVFTDILSGSLAHNPQNPEVFLKPALLFVITNEYIENGSKLQLTPKQVDKNHETTTNIQRVFLPAPLTPSRRLK